MTLPPAPQTHATLPFSTSRMLLHFARLMTRLAAHRTMVRHTQHLDTLL